MWRAMRLLGAGETYTAPEVVDWAPGGARALAASLPPSGGSGEGLSPRAVSCSERTTGGFCAELPWTGPGGPQVPGYSARRP